jgi:hypothetical protein
MMVHFWIANLHLRHQFYKHHQLVAQMKLIEFSNAEIAEANQGWTSGIKLMYVGIILDRLQGVDADGKVLPN